MLCNAKRVLFCSFHSALFYLISFRGNYIKSYEALWRRDILSMTFAIPLFRSVYLFVPILFYIPWMEKKPIFSDNLTGASYVFLFARRPRVATLLLRDACSWNFKPDGALSLPVVGSYNSERSKSIVHPSRIQLSSSLLRTFSLLKLATLWRILFLHYYEATLRASTSFEKLIYPHRAITLFLKLSHLLTIGIWRVENLSRGSISRNISLMRKVGFVLSLEEHKLHFFYITWKWSFRNYTVAHLLIARWKWVFVNSFISRA